MTDEGRPSAARPFRPHEVEPPRDQRGFVINGLFHEVEPPRTQRLAMRWGPPVGQRLLATVDLAMPDLPPAEEPIG